jgi:hypothetical protein
MRAAKEIQSFEMYSIRPARQWPPYAHPGLVRRAPRMRRLSVGKMKPRSQRMRPRVRALSFSFSLGQNELYRAIGPLWPRLSEATGPGDRDSQDVARKHRCGTDNLSVTRRIFPSKAQDRVLFETSDGHPNVNLHSHLKSRASERFRFLIKIFNPRSLTSPIILPLSSHYPPIMPPSLARNTRAHSHTRTQADIEIRIRRRRIDREARDAEASANRRRLASD